MVLQRSPSPLREQQQGNKTVTSSQEFADGTHACTQDEGDKRECVRWSPITSPF